MSLRLLEENLKFKKKKKGTLKPIPNNPCITLTVKNISNPSLRI